MASENFRGNITFLKAEENLLFSDIRFSLPFVNASRGMKKEYLSHIKKGKAILTFKISLILE